MPENDDIKMQISLASSRSQTRRPGTTTRGSRRRSSTPRPGGSAAHSRVQIPAQTAVSSTATNLGSRS